MKKKTVKAVVFTTTSVKNEQYFVKIETYKKLVVRLSESQCVSKSLCFSIKVCFSNAGFEKTTREDS